MDELHTLPDPPYDSDAQDNHDISQTRESNEENYSSKKDATISSCASNTIRIKQECTDQNVENMFASVWVKVEIVEENITVEPDVDPFTKPKRKRNRPVKFKCDQCDYVTAYKNCLKIHIDGHNNTNPYNCSLCEYTTKFPSALNRHMLLKHPDEQKTSVTLLKCEECDYSTYYKWNLNSHKKRHLQIKQYKCPHCEYATAFKQHLNKHTKKHEKTADGKDMLYKCDQCPFVTRFEGHISRHLAKIHNIVSDKANRCDFCDFSTKVNWRLNVHKAKSRQSEVIKCLYCGFETWYMCESKKHRRMHYDDVSKQKGTTLLPQIYPTNDDEDEETLENNLGEKLDGIAPNENFAESQQNDKTEYYRYEPDGVNWNSIDVQNSDNKEKPYKCYMCNYTARYKASVQRHFQRRHTLPESRPYKCLNCDFSTKTKDQIALHNKRSQSTFLISCNKCKFTTQFKCQSVMHQKTHYEQECPNCDFKCRNKYDMQRHFTIVHLGDGLKCKYCDYQATRKESLLCHETSHTGIKPFKCSKCDYTAVRKSLLTNHITRYHGGTSDDVTIISENKIQSLKFPIETILQNFQANGLQS